MPAKIRDDVTVNLRQDICDFVFERRRAQRQIFLPSLGDVRTLFQKEKQIDRDENETEQEPEYAEKSADAFQEKVPKLLRQCGNVALQIGDLFFDVSLNALAVGG